jgi:hypothetical protein
VEPRSADLLAVQKRAVEYDRVHQPYNPWNETKEARDTRKQIESAHRTSALLLTLRGAGTSAEAGEYRHACAWDDRLVPLRLPHEDTPTTDIASSKLAGAEPLAPFAVGSTLEFSAPNYGLSVRLESKGRGAAESKEAYNKRIEAEVNARVIPGAGSYEREPCSVLRVFGPYVVFRYRLLCLAFTVLACRSPLT